MGQGKYVRGGMQGKEESGGEVQGVLCKPGENFKRRLAGLCAGLHRRKRGRGRITPGFRFCRPSEGTEAAEARVLVFPALGAPAAPGEVLGGVSSGSLRTKKYPPQIAADC